MSPDMIFSKAFKAISRFPYLITLLSEYVIKWGFNSYWLMKILLHTGWIFLLHRRWGRTALACKFWILKNSLTYTSYQWGRKATHDYDRTTYYFEIVTYSGNILTYWDLYCYRPLINRAFKAIPWFTYQIISLFEYGINKGF